MKILVTGTAGFIGFHVTKKLLDEGYTVVGLDSVNEYYDIKLKLGRLSMLGIKNFENSNVYGKFSFHKIDLFEREKISRLFEENKFDIVIHLAAQAGVRYSLKDPLSYINSNIHGFFNILECCRENIPSHLIFASSSSVYGLNSKIPFSTNHHTDHPISLYAATKKSNEMMAHSYSHLFRIPCTGLRFFTVYGPWGRPDMAYYSFTKKILVGEAIDVYNNGDQMRDFTYIDDIVKSITLLMKKPPEHNFPFDSVNSNPAVSSAPYRLFNIGNNNPIKLMDFIEAIEKAIGKKAILNFKPAQPGDVQNTFADVSDLKKIIGFQPKTPIEEGLKHFVKWYKEFI